jgi:hypothetical protein
MGCRGAISALREAAAAGRVGAVDAALLVPNRSAYHLSLTLAARLLFCDFPFGNGAARPHDPASQLLAFAAAARTTVQSPLRWSANADWKLDYFNVERLPRDEIDRRRVEVDTAMAQARQLRQQAALGRTGSS